LQYVGNGTSGTSNNVTIKQNTACQLTQLN
jgi:hypothetical protein